MITKTKEGLKWLKFEILKPYKQISHGTLTRSGGFSKPPFDSLNSDIVFNDNSPDIEKNLSKIKKVLNLTKVVFSKQVHEKKIVKITSDNFFERHVCDGFVTNEKGITLFIKHADCQAALFFDPVKNVIGNVHSGWRGNVLNIYKEMVHKMTQIYGSNLKDILVVISPSLGPQNAEFINYKKDFPKYFWPFQVKENHFDLWAIAKHQLEKEGILKENIEIAEIDTFTNAQDFFSYRREKVTGRNLTFIQLL